MSLTLVSRRSYCLEIWKKDSDDVSYLKYPIIDKNNNIIEFNPELTLLIQFVSLKNGVKIVLNELIIMVGIIRQFILCLETELQ